MIKYITLTKDLAYSLLSIAIENNSDTSLSIILDRMIEQNIPVLTVLQGTFDTFHSFDPFDSGPFDVGPFETATSKAARFSLENLEKKPLAHLTIENGYSNTLEKLLAAGLSSKEKAMLFAQEDKTEAQINNHLLHKVANTRNTDTIISFLSIFEKIRSEASSPSLDDPISTIKQSILTCLSRTNTKKVSHDDYLQRSVTGVDYQLRDLESYIIITQRLTPELRELLSTVKK